MTATPDVRSWLLTLADKAKTLREELAVIAVLSDTPETDRLLTEACVDLAWVESDVRSAITAPECAEHGGAR